MRIPGVAVGTSVVFPLFGDDVRLVKARTAIAEIVSLDIAIEGRAYVIETNFLEPTLTSSAARCEGD